MISYFEKQLAELDHSLHCRQSRSRGFWEAGEGVGGSVKGRTQDHCVWSWEKCTDL